MDKLTDFNLKSIGALDVPATNAAFYGTRGLTVQNKPVPGGLGVRVTPAGVRSFVLNYAIKGRERRYTIGRVADWSVPAVIERARQLKRQIENGVDPQDEHKPVATAKSLTVRDIFNRWLVSPNRKDKPSVHQRHSFENHILPAIGDVPYRELRKSAIGEMYDAIAATAGPVAANRSLSYLQAVLNRQEARDDDWTAPRLGKIKEYTETERKRTLTPDEIRVLWAHWDAEPDRPANLICKLILLSGQRPGDISDLEWREISLEGATATIPATRYKTRVDQTFALSEPALAILSGVPKRNDGRVFKEWNESREKRAMPQFDPKWTFHDLRRTAKTLMAKNGVLPHVSERVLGHAQPRIEGTYDDHDYLPEKKHAAKVLAGAIDLIINPPADVVVPMRKAAAE